ncbi:conserved Plasmodium protein, unknown function [Plasmodium knowlesi strain H]|uniref:Secreted ookinete protein n=3 Tax=Plasmodium knowlesi TaxID=5850 RepID=A0A5K1V0K3_PLAKH|nr:conserved Plasmodium protein, unknown function [Plasmodium knowlesi strain H]OTN67379.1 Uncharacterized protein PKNOH_S06420000 [Plasmodium knowlesi]CAA9987473.1 conserved Plasmodium protein, unknown function [Plasmodium knowlesi strain H]SBO23210.1 conserved Plasmodium protein, unknown function [Plasmodium knowlesi strain H]SBO23986.1 conserved Plasmodium protein, unknown function [Plasmodium knowlesi strain H]VVS76947.1 conserved Plasmodium protein, unknown function [Plasmodium knowlesi s|eukprot:XP_002258474.1 hypothetical protein, conserved in Plasmodium species [Plasmodium knowlesi strain H]
MSPLFFIFSFFLSLSLERQIGLVAKRMQRPLNVYYRDYSAHLPIEERDKLMKMKLDDEGNENLQDDIEGAIDINKMHAQESELGALLKGQMELSRQIREDLRGRTRKNKQMSVKYNHGDSDAVDGYWTGENKDAEHFDVDTEIEVPTDSMREPVVLVKIPAVDIYDQMEMLHDVGHLMDIKNEDVLY